MILRAVSTALLLAFPFAVNAQTMEFGCPASGTTITFDSGTQVVAKSQDGMDCVMDTVGGKPFKIRALLFANPSADGSDMSSFINALRPERLWPLSVGKKIEADYSVGGKRWHYILNVVSFEKRMGPANTLIDAYQIEMNEQGPDGFRSVSRWWISPADKYMIRFDASNSAGTANRAVVTEVKK
jgi:hypothetical protein